MPELPEVETIVRGLRRKAVGKRINRVTLLMSQILRCSDDDFVRTILGKTIKGIDRRGKFILIALSGGWSLLIHLKMTGQLKWIPQAQNHQKHTHVVFHLAQCPFQLHYCDIRRFGYLLLLKTDCMHDVPPLRDLGPEPLEMKEPEFVELLRNRKGRMKSLLLNQSFLAGLGNIYADESLWRARIHPLTQAHRISPRKARRLLGAIQAVLEEAIENKGSSVDDYRDVEGRKGKHQFCLRAYGRQGQACYYCGALIRRIVINSRSSHFCPRCQRKPG
ncbi:MAG: bifunctional DNA-formamidopyrimidine glycosylase/DNA-(apurinic or apyrimidinic site) lyase [Gemmatimonadota bacterium]|nr:MAG: bifunctional DNA-formamidopyrimidine glycosylase/DNA-(apurinic or apyrimidinic site) lyase [Gemmatimonadota bacterium]